MRTQEYISVREGIHGAIMRGIDFSRSVEDREVLDRLFQGVPGDKAIDREVIHDIMNTGVAAPRFRRYSQANIMAESAVDSALESGKALENYLTSSQHDINILLGA